MAAQRAATFGRRAALRRPSERRECADGLAKAAGSACSPSPSEGAGAVLMALTLDCRCVSWRCWFDDEASDAPVQVRAVRQGEPGRGQPRPGVPEAAGRERSVWCGAEAGRRLRGGGRGGEPSEAISPPGFFCVLAHGCVRSWRCCCCGCDAAGFVGVASIVTALRCCRDCLRDGPC